MKALVVGVLLLLGFGGAAWAGLEAKLVSGVAEKRLEVRNCKRGLYIRAGAVSTRSVQWEYHFVLKGAGPVYGPENIVLRDKNAKPIEVSGGEVKVEDKRVLIGIRTKVNGREQVFAQNGTYGLGGK